jgi:hypothetical protein
MFRNITTGLMLLIIAGVWTAERTLKGQPFGLAPPNAVRSGDGDTKPEENELNFQRDGEDLIVTLMIEGPAARQVVLTNHWIDDRRPSIDEIIVRDLSDAPPKTPGPPHVTLRYCVIVNSDLPGFVDGGLLSVPTPREERFRQRQEVQWRLRSFGKGKATFTVDATRFETSSEQLREAWPKLKKLVEQHEKAIRGLKPP